MCKAELRATAGEGFPCVITIESEYDELIVRLNGICQQLADQQYVAVAVSGQRSEAGAKAEPDAVACGVCGGPCWDNRQNKRSPKAPDYKCRDAKCAKGAWVNIDKDSGREVLSAWK